MSNGLSNISVNEMPGCFPLLQEKLQEDRFDPPSTTASNECNQNGSSGEGSTVDLQEEEGAPCFLKRLPAAARSFWSEESKVRVVAIRLLFD
jgi:hypothetical protein